MRTKFPQTRLGAQVSLILNMIHSLRIKHIPVARLLKTMCKYNPLPEAFSPLIDHRRS